MGAKAKSAVERTKGKVKTAAGRATNNRSLEMKGRVEQKKGNARAAANKAKDALTK